MPMKPCILQHYLTILQCHRKILIFVITYNALANHAFVLLSMSYGVDCSIQRKTGHSIARLINLENVEILAINVVCA